MRPAWNAAALVAILATAAGLTACDENLQIENAAADPAELARFLPGEPALIHTTDIAESRQELGLPDDADATPADPSALRDGDSPQTKLFELTSRSFPLVSMAYAEKLNGTGASPLDGTLVRAAAYDSAEIYIVSTAEPFAQVADKLKRDGYAFKNDMYLAGADTPAVASPVVADGGSGRVVFADTESRAKKTLRRIEERAEPGTAAEALNSVSGSVKVATTGVTPPPRSARCIEALAAAQSATGKGAIMALEISGEKPEPERFDPSRLRTLDVGTPSVLVDALLVPFNIAKPTGNSSEPISELLSFSYTEQIDSNGERRRGPTRGNTPLESYDCP